LGDVINHNGAVGVSIVHGSQRLVSFLAGGIPDFEFDCRVFVQRDGLCQEGGANRRLSVVIKLILFHVNMGILSRKSPLKYFPDHSLLRISERANSRRVVSMLVTVTIAGGEGISFNLSDSRFSYNQSNNPSQRLSNPSCISKKVKKFGAGSVGERSPSKTSLNWANLAPGRAPAAALEAIIRVRGRGAIGGKENRSSIEVVL